MTTATHQFAAFVLAAATTLAVVAGMNSLATARYAAADTLAMSDIAQMQVAVQHVTVVGHRATA